MTNLTEHKCAGKCPEFKGEQCNHCLVPNMGDDKYLENHILSRCRVMDSEESVHLLRAFESKGGSVMKEYLKPISNGECVECYQIALANEIYRRDWIEIPEGAEFLIMMCTGLKVGERFFFKYDDGDLRLHLDSEWTHASYDCIQEYLDEGDVLLWSRKPIQKPQPEEPEFQTIKVKGLEGLIEGTAALRAALDGETVQFSLEPWEEKHWDDFLPQVDGVSTKIFFTDVDKYGRKIFFRMKPKTISINGIEVPAPMNQTLKEGVEFFYLDDSNPDGYSSGVHDNSYSNKFKYGWWDSEEKIKLVAAALRKVFGVQP